jgi:hypothetical protein
MVQFDNTFQMNVHLDIIKKIGLANGLDFNNLDATESQTDFNSTTFSEMLPKLFQPYIKRDILF